MSIRPVTGVRRGCDTAGVLLCSPSAVLRAACDDRTVTPPYVAQLRVYEPLSAFSPEERRHWEEYVQAGRSPGRVDGPILERAVGLGSALRPMARVPRMGEIAEHAYVVQVDGAILICPWRTTVRCWQAATDVPVSMPDGVAASVLPSTEIAEAATSYAQWAVENPAQHTHIMTSRWIVPLRWFVLFDREERRLRLGARQVGRGAAESRAAAEAGAEPPGPVAERSLIYVTQMSHARRRAARGLSVLRKAVDDGPVLIGVEEVARWLEEFHPRSVVELDYGGLVHLLGDEELRTDDSAGDVAEALSALARGDVKDAGAAYDRIIERWRMAQLVESAN